jgi:hypothetical protein
MDMNIGGCSLYVKPISGQESNRVCPKIRSARFCRSDEEIHKKETLKRVCVLTGIRTVKVKVKSLHLTKYHAMKKYSLLN